MAPMIIFTSHSGIGAKSFLQSVAASASGSSAVFLDDTLLSTLGRDDWFSAHQEDGIDRIQQQWANVYRGLAIPAGSGPILLHSHLVQYHDDLQIPFAAANFRAIADHGRVAAVVTLCDDVYEVLTPNRFPSLAAYVSDGADAEDTCTRYLDSLRTLLLWRSYDMITALALANSLECPHYVVSVRHDPAVIGRLVAGLCLEASAPESFYFSHHVRAIRGLGSAWKDEASLVNRAASRIQSLSNVVLFEPTTIDEYLIDAGKANDRWPRETGAREFTFTDSLAECFRTVGLEVGKFVEKSEVLMVSIGRDVTWRDLLMVRQSDGILMWRPFWRGLVSGGAMRELEVFAKREKSSRAILVHQEGDLASWVTNNLPGLLADRGCQLRTPLNEVGRLFEQQLLNGVPDWGHLARVTADSLSVEKPRAVLGKGSASKGKSVQKKKIEAATKALEELYKSHTFFQSIETLRVQGKLEQHCSKSLDSTEAVDQFAKDLCGNLSREGRP